MTKKSIAIILGSAVALCAIVGLTAFLLLRPTWTIYQYVSAEKRHMQETVRASGEIKPAESVDLSFERSGRIAAINFKAGDAIKTGDVLMELDNAVEGAQVMQARALLTQRSAGTAQTEIAIYQAAADAARADLDKAKADTAGQLDTAQAAVDTAQNNLKLASGGEDSQIVGQAYENAVTMLQASLPKLDDALNQADQILGVDNPTVSLNYKTALSALDTSKLTTAQNLYHDAKQQITDTRNAVSPLTAASPHDSIDGAIVNVQNALNKANQLLSSVSEVLNASVSGSVLPQATLNGMKSTIQLTRSGITAQANSVVAGKQGIDNSKNSLNTYTIAYTKAKEDFTNLQASVASAVKLKEAAYQQALANLNNKKAPTRGVDLAPLRAALDAAEVAFGKTLLKSPLDGIVSKQDGKIGAIVLPNVPVASVINEKNFQIEIFIPETDVAKLKVGDQAEVSIDAYGADTKFPAAVVKLDPGSTTVNGNSVYKVTLQFTQPDERLKEGMTANAAIITQDKADATAVPGRSVIQKSGEYYVMVKSGQGAPAERQVQIGIKGADGWWEVTSGIGSGDQLVDFGK